MDCVIQSHFPQKIENIYQHFNVHKSYIIEMALVATTKPMEEGLSLELVYKQGKSDHH